MQKMGGIQCPICSNDDLKKLSGGWYQCKQCKTEFGIRVNFMDAEQYSLEKIELIEIEEEDLNGFLKKRKEAQ